MANSIIGVVHSIGQTQRIPTKSGNALLKRELVLDASRFDEYTGEKRENFPSFTFMSKNCEKLNEFHAGDRVTVSFVIQGRSYQKDGQTKYINDVVGYKVEAYGTPSQAPSAPAPSVQPPQEQDESLPF